MNIINNQIYFATIIDTNLVLYIIDLNFSNIITTKIYDISSIFYRPIDGSVPMNIEIFNNMIYIYNECFNSVIKLDNLLNIYFDELLINQLILNNDYWLYKTDDDIYILYAANPNNINSNNNNFISAYSITKQREIYTDDKFLKCYLFNYIPVLPLPPSQPNMTNIYYLATSFTNNKLYQFGFNPENNTLVIFTFITYNEISDGIQLPVNITSEDLPLCLNLSFKIKIKKDIPLSLINRPEGQPE
jgi:hypothetical protein